jgi:hypothetical protein
MVRLERLGNLKKKIHFIGNRSRNLPAYSTVPQPTTLPRVPQASISYLTPDHTDEHVYIYRVASGMRVRILFSTV